MPVGVLAAFLLAFSILSPLVFSSDLPGVLLRRPAQTSLLSSIIAGVSGIRNPSRTTAGPGPVGSLGFGESGLSYVLDLLILVSGRHGTGTVTGTNREGEEKRGPNGEKQ